MRDESGLCLLGVLLRMNAQTDPGSHTGHNGVDRLVHWQRVQSRDRYRRPRPEMLTQSTGTEQRKALAHFRQFAELRFAVRLAGPRLASQPRDCDVAFLVMQAGERVQEHN